jgi:hypothetical protein
MGAAHQKRRSLGHTKAQSSTEKFIRQSTSRSEMRSITTPINSFIVFIVAAPDRNAHYGQR